VLRRGQPAVRVFQGKAARLVIHCLVGQDIADGVFVLATTPGSPVGRKGFVEGDYITHIDGNTVTSASEVCDVFESATPGSLVKVQGL
jgi:S1-C subfamily serine protease